MSNGEARSIAITAASQRAGKQLVDVVWLMTMVACLVAIGVPWYLRLVDVRMVVVAATVFGFSLLYSIASGLVTRVRDRRRAMLASSLFNAFGVLCLVAIWHLGGGLSNPVLLRAFVAPLVASGALLAGWQTHLLALLSILGVATIALLESPELRWMLGQSGGPIGWLSGVLPDLPPARLGSVSAVDGSPAYVLVVVGSFALLLFCVALASDALTALSLRSHERIFRSRGATQDAETLALALVRNCPFPTVLVDAKTGEIVMASQSFADAFFCRGDEVAGRRLVEIAEFAYPDDLVELIRHSEGEVAGMTSRVDGEIRVLRIGVRRLEGWQGHHALVTFTDVTPFHHLSGALAASSDPFLAVGPDGRFTWLNPGVEPLFGELEIGQEASAVLEREDLPNGWWQPSSRHPRLTLDGREYSIERMDWKLPGERRACCAVRLRDLGGAD